METNLNLNLGNEILTGTEVSTNVRQQIIVVPKDRAKLILKEYEEQLKGKVDWKSPLAIVITLLGTLLTAEFKNGIMGFDKEFWHALFIIAFIASCVWAIRAIILAMQQKCKSVDAVVEELRDNKFDPPYMLEIEDLPRDAKWFVKLILRRNNKIA